MKTLLRLLFFLLCIYGGGAFALSDTVQPALVFKENKGQWDKQALFETELQNGSIYLSRDSFTFIMADTGDMNRVRRGHHPWMYRANLDLTVHLHIFRQVFENANAAAVSGSNQLREYYNYFLGNDRSKWAGGVHGFFNVTYPNLYHNIDLEVSSQGVNMKYDFVVKKGGNAADIKLRYVGTEGVAIDREGDLELKTSIGDVVDSKPYAYQYVNGEKQAINCIYRQKGDEVWFDFPDGYDKTADLVIDPTLIFSTYSGSDADNFGYSATYDNAGNAYAAGSVFEFNGKYPTTPGAFQTSWAGGVGFGLNEYDGTGTDIAVTKYDSMGRTRIYSTYLGGDHDELPHSLIVNSNNELFVLGSTASDNFPVTANAFDVTFNGGVDMGVFNGIGVHYKTGSDIIITHFNADGTALIGSTYVGGSDNDGLTYPEYVGLNYNYADDVRGEIALDANGNVYVASTTRSKNFPVTAGAYQTSLNGDSSDAVVFKMDGGLSHMIWSTYLGGTDNDAAYSIDFDPSGNLFIGGGTISTDFPATAGVIQNHNAGGRADGFIAHLSQNGNTLLGATYWGSTAYDQVYFVRADKTGHVYAFGQTEATDSTFIRNAAYNVLKGGQFITKFSGALDSIIWSTAWGTGKGTPDISPTAFLVDVCNKTYCSGWGSNFYTYYGIVGAPPLTTGGLQVTPNAVQLTTDSNDFYILVMEDDASALNYATYFGSPTDEDHVDGGTSRFDKRGIIYESACAGCNGQSSFPTTSGVVSNTNNSANCNNAVFKINFNFPIVVAAFANPPTGCTPDTVNFTNQSQIATTATYMWTFGDGTSSTATSPTHVYTTSGIYIVQLVVNDPGSCNLTDTITHQIVVIAQAATDTIAPVSICLGQKGQIGIAPSYDSSITYTWVPTTYLNQSNIANPFSQPPVSINYTLLVSNGVCTDTFKQSVLVDTNTLLLTGDSVICGGDTTTLTAINSQAGQYTYSWQPASQILSGANSATATALPAQSQTFVFTETTPTGCSFSDSIHITVSAGPQTTVGFASPAPVCAPDTVAFNNQSQATGNPTFQWSFGDGDTSTAFSPTHIYSQPGIYTVQMIATYPGICKVVDTVKHQVIALAAGALDTLPKQSLCNGQVVQIGLSTGADSTVTYSWTPSASLSQSNIPNPLASPAQSTTYQLIVHAGTCTDTFTQQVLVDSDALVLQGGAVNCPGDTLTLHASDIENQQLSYVWQPASSIVSGDSSANPLVKLQQNTTFIVTAVTPKGCTLVDSVKTTVTSGFPSVHAYAVPDTIKYGDTAQLNLTLSANVISINWQPDSTLIGLLTSADPQADPKVTNTYYVEVSDSSACKRYDTVIVYVVQPPCAQTNIYIPNAFSPNGDGRNDVLYVRGNGITELYFAVYDRWGERVFETNDQTVGWDGTYKGKKMDAAVFGYYVEGMCPSGEKFKKKGNVTVLR